VEYSNRFQALMPRAGRLDEAQRVQLFTGGLLPLLSQAIRIHNSETLAAAMSLARQVELMEIDRPVHPHAASFPFLRPGQRSLALRWPASRVAAPSGPLF
jgi:hypothetical protein